MRGGARIALAALVLAAVPVETLAHPLSPALLDVRESAGGRVDVTWKTSLAALPGARVLPVLPAGCQALGPSATTEDDTSRTERWTARCDGGLVGGRLGVEGLAGAGIDALVRVVLADGRLVQGVLRARAPFLEVPARPRRRDVAADYARLGIEHILGGPDHLLFVLGLVLLVAGSRSLVRTITAFTLGHSVTLSLAALGWARVPAGPIEVLIALTVFLLAVELARGPDAPPTRMRRRPWAMAFVFGLLHGLGFAGALAAAGLPAGEIPLALLSFNSGIELGQLLFVAVVVGVRGVLRALAARPPRWAAWVPVYAMGSLAAFWCFERAAALFF